MSWHNPMKEKRDYYSFILYCSPILQLKILRLKGVKSPIQVHMASRLKIKPGRVVPGPVCHHGLILLPLLTVWTKYDFLVCLLYWILSNLRPRDCFLAIAVAPLPTQDQAQVRNMNPVRSLAGLRTVVIHPSYICSLTYPALKISKTMNSTWREIQVLCLK